MKTKQETAEKQEKELAEKEELNEKELEAVAGGVRKRTTGPGTQTEDDVYVG